MRSRPIVYASR